MSQRSSSPVEFLNNNFLPILLVIVVFGAGFLLGSNWKENQLKSKVQDQASPSLIRENAPTAQVASTLDQTPAVTAQDHKTGASNPKITLIEYSDFGCGFCGRVHPTLKRIVENYPNQVAWVYRHYLLSSTGPSRVVAETSECVAKYSGNEAFWSFIAEFFKRSAEDRSIMEQDNVLSLVESMGFNKIAVSRCLESGEMSQIVEQQIAGGRAAGIKGTPGIIIVTTDGQYDLVAGAAPYEDFVQKIEKYL